VPSSGFTSTEVSAARSESSLAPTTHETAEERPASRAGTEPAQRHHSGFVDGLAIWGPAGAVVGVPALLMLSATLLIPSESLEVSARQARASSLFSAPAEFEPSVSESEDPRTKVSAPEAASEPLTRPARRVEPASDIRTGRRGFSPVRERQEAPVRALQVAPPPQALTVSMASPLALKGASSSASARPAHSSEGETARQADAGEDAPTSGPREPVSVAPGSSESDAAAVSQEAAANPESAASPEAAANPEASAENPGE
jgi:hypothetical protein